MNRYFSRKSIKMANNMKKCLSLITREITMKTTMKHHFTPLLGWLLLKVNKQKTSVREYVEKLDPCALLVGLYNGAVIVEQQMEAPQKVKHRTII